MKHWLKMDFSLNYTLWHEGVHERKILYDFLKIYKKIFEEMEKLVRSERTMLFIKWLNKWSLPLLIAVDTDG